MWRIASVIQRRPLASAMVVAGVKTSSADILVQTAFQGRDIRTVDWQRSAFFGAFGSLYLGGFLHFLYVRCYQTWFPLSSKFASLPIACKMRHRAGLKQLCQQVGFDQFIHIPFIYFPVFYILKDAMENKDLLSAPSNGLSKYGINIVDDNIAQWILWIPGTIVNFAFCPLWLRVPFTAAVSFVWTGILSVRQYNVHV